MFELEPSMELLASFALAVGVILQGGFGLLSKRRRLRHVSWVVPLTLALLMAIPGFTLALSSHPSYLSLPLIALSCFWTFFAFIHSPLPGFLFRHADILRRSWIHSGALVVLGVALISWQVYTLDQQLAIEQIDSDIALQSPQPPELRPIPGLSALTDRGRSIPLMSLVVKAHSSPTEELSFIRSMNLESQIIQTGQPDESYNCHGWVFANGTAWIRGEEVKTILVDNQYQVASEPAIGDLVIFHDASGNVKHSALVCSILHDGAVLLESKWGKMGRYIHTLHRHSYQQFKCTIYRSPRSGHRLHMERPPKPVFNEGA